MHTRIATVVTAGILLASTGAFAQGGGQQQFEVNESTFEQWDGNDDGHLSKQEFTKGARNVGLFNMWDGNNDNRIDQTEFDEIGFEGTFSTWDANNSGYLDPNEIYNGAFATNDSDQDGRWAMEEWNDFGDQGWFDW